MSLATLFQEVESAFRPCCSTGIAFTEEEGHFVLEALAAGLKADQIEISVERGSVCIEAKSDKYRYSYLAPLPVGEIDESVAPEASLEDGILKVRFPKAKVAKPLKITIK